MPYNRYPSYRKNVEDTVLGSIHFHANLPSQNTLRHIPDYPWGKKIIDRWGQIKMLSELECGAPWELYVETAGPAALKLFLTIIAPGKIDIQKARLNHSYNCGFKKLFRNVEEVLPNAAPGATKFLFRYTKVPFLNNWYFFLADAFTEFVYNWESAVIQNQQCNVHPLGGPCQLSNASNNVAIQNAFFPMNWRTRDNDPSGWAGPNSPWNVVTPGHIGSYKTYASGQFHNSTPFTQTVTFQIGDATHIVAGPSSTSIAPGQSGSVTIFGNAIETNGANARFQASYAISQTHAAGVQAFGGSFTVAAT